MASKSQKSLKNDTDRHQSLIYIDSSLATRQIHEA